MTTPERLAKLEEKTANIEEAVGGLDKKVDTMGEKLDLLIEKLDERYERKFASKLSEKIVYGLCAAVAIAVVGVMVHNYFVHPITTSVTVSAH